MPGVIPIACTAFTFNAIFANAKKRAQRRRAYAGETLQCITSAVLSKTFLRIHGSHLMLREQRNNPIREAGKAEQWPPSESACVALDLGFVIESSSAPSAFLGGNMETGKLSRSASGLLKVMSILNNEGMDDEMLKKGISEVTPLATYPKNLDEYTEAREQLLDFFVVYTKEDRQSLCMQPDVQTAIASRMNARECDDAYATAAMAVAEYWELDPEALDKCPVWSSRQSDIICQVGKLESVFRRRIPQQPSDRDLWSPILFLKAAYFTDSWKAIDLAKKSISLVVAEIDEGRISGCARMARAYNVLGLCYTRQKFRNSLAEECFQISVRSYKRLSDAPFSGVWPAVNLAFLHLARGQPNDAEKVLKDAGCLDLAVAFSKDKKNTDFPAEIGAVLRAVGHIKRAEKNYDASAKFHTQALDYRRKAYSSAHFWICDCLHDCAIDMVHLGRRQEAVQFFEKAREIYDNSLNYNFAAQKGRIFWNGSCLLQAMENENHATWMYTGRKGGRRHVTKTAHVETRILQKQLGARVQGTLENEAGNRNVYRA
ncbi:hypothetical protein BDY21DRAFT_422726 [Lineolata rhizophorae]|uniref:DUF7779 domain-containing protein n=1 Tax=Lineolata rhizophorae TaxID=578093 RepID=A0A6A6NW36_9PEZI|nr:hypothetical protein BDY21DRAFT_422726 [Lineolata rhizophorae]